ncbi:MAG TPA: hypothetical protein VFY41_00175 [Nitrososphaeraceae archaeon]|nr:hypothetical protein [Nitrososphaeraceae archaeon]HJY09529.1 hypothetical protein [Nitrososphaeraceae archaeon]
MGRKRILQFIDDDGTIYLTNLSKKQLKSIIDAIPNNKKASKKKVP